MRVRHGLSRPNGKPDKGADAAAVATNGKPDEEPDEGCAHREADHISRGVDRRAHQIANLSTKRKPDRCAYALAVRERGNVAADHLPVVIAQHEPDGGADGGPIAEPVPAVAIFACAYSRAFVVSNAGANAVAHKGTDISSEEAPAQG